MTDLVARLRKYDTEDKAFNVFIPKDHNFAFPPEGLIEEAADEIERLTKWADGFSDAQLEERRTGEEYQRELRAEIERLAAELADMKDDYLRRRNEAVDLFQQVIERDKVIVELCDELEALLLTEHPYAPYHPDARLKYDNEMRLPRRARALIASDKDQNDG